MSEHNSLPANFPELNEEEVYFIKLLARELSHEQIAHELKLNLAQVKKMQADLARKLNVKSEVGIVLIALKYGIPIL